MLSIFKFHGRPIGASVSRWLDDEEYHAARTYILLNCDEVKPFINVYEQELRLQNSAIQPVEVEKKLETSFSSWFASHVKDPMSNVQDQMIKDLASGPLRNIKMYSGYYVNGFKFQVVRRDSTTLTNNSDIIMADDAHDQVGDRIVLQVVGNNFIPHGHRVSAYITSKFKLQQYASGHTWGNVGKDGKDFYYKKFLKIYTWQPGNEEEFKATWNLYCQVQYKKLLHKWRKMSHSPEHVSNVVWNAWQSVWSQEKWKRNSEKAKQNRNSEVAGPGTGVTKHTAGSRSIIEHTLKLEADLKRKTDCWEVFRNTHRHKDGTFVDARSQAINDNMTAKVTELSQASTDGDESHIPSQDDINNIYYDIVGGMKKSRIYGLGSQAKVMFPHAISTYTSKGRPGSSFVAIEELRTENVELKARMVELEKTSAENTELKARIANLEETMRAFMSRMAFSQTLVPPSAFPDYSSPIIDSDETQP